MMFLHVRVDDEEIAKGNLNGTAATSFRASRRPRWRRSTRDALALTPFAEARATALARREVELGAEGVGTLRNRLVRD